MSKEDRIRRQQTRLPPYHTPHTQTHSTGFLLLYFVAPPQIKISPLRLEDHISTMNHSTDVFFHFTHLLSSNTRDIRNLQRQYASQVQSPDKHDGAQVSEGSGRLRCIEYGKLISKPKLDFDSRWRSCHFRVLSPE